MACRKNCTCHNDQGGTAPCPDAQSLEQSHHARALFAADRENTDDGKDDSNTGNDHRSVDAHHHIGGSQLSGNQRKSGAESGCRKNRSAVGFVKVGAHTGNVADVVTDIVRDGGRVAGIVFRNAGFDFADQVGADVSRFRVDAAADTGKESLRRSAHAERQHGRGDFHQLVIGSDRTGFYKGNAEDGKAVCHVLRGVNELVEDKIPCRDVEKAEADDDQSHDRSGTERDLKSAVQALTGTLRSSAGRRSSRLHSEETAQSGEETSGQERHGYEGVLHTDDRENCEDDEEHKEHDSHAGILLFEISHRALADVTGNLLHRGVSFGCLDHEFVADQSRDKRNNGADRGNPPHGGNSARNQRLRNGCLQVADQIIRRCRRCQRHHSRSGDPCEERGRFHFSPTNLSICFSTHICALKLFTIK